MARRTVIDGVGFSKFKVSVLELLKKYGFIKDFSIETSGDVKKSLTIHLKEVTDHINDIPVIKFYSKPSRRWYVSYKDLKSVAGGRGIGIISTPQGLMPTHIAKTKKLGGELIADIY